MDYVTISSPTQSPVDPQAFTLSGGGWILIRLPVTLTFTQPPGAYVQVPGAVCAVGALQQGGVRACCVTLAGVLHPLQARCSWWVFERYCARARGKPLRPSDLHVDVAAMREAAAILLGTRDFSALMDTRRAAGALLASKNS